MNRLEEIKSRNYMSGSQSISMKVVKEDVNWLIERVQKLEEALKFYAWILPEDAQAFQGIFHEYGEKAREALRESDGFEKK